MTVVVSMTVFVIAYVAVWLISRRSLFDAALGFGLLAHAGNLIMLASGGFAGGPPLVTDAKSVARSGGPDPSVATAGDPPAVMDPLPQAMILTAIVISMALLLYLVALYRRNAQEGVEEWS